MNSAGDITDAINLISPTVEYDVDPIRNLKNTRILHIPGGSIKEIA